MRLILRALQEEGPQRRSRDMEISTNSFVGRFCPDEPNIAIFTVVTPGAIVEVCYQNTLYELLTPLSSLFFQTYGRVKK